MTDFWVEPTPKFQMERQRPRLSHYFEPLAVPGLYAEL